MSNYIKLSIGISLFVAFNCSMFAYGQDDVVELKRGESQNSLEHKRHLLEYEKTLTDEEKEKFREGKRLRRAKVDKASDESLKALMKESKRMNTEMETNEFAVVPESQIESEKWYSDNEKIFVKNLSESMPFGFSSFNAEKGPLKKTEYIGSFGMPEADGYLHDVTHMFKHKKYGRIVIQEFSFGTSTETEKFSVSKLKNNIEVSGLPAEYMVAKGEESGKGITTLVFYTDSTLYWITIYDALMSEKDRAYLRRLGKSLL